MSHSPGRAATPRSRRGPRPGAARLGRLLVGLALSLPLSAQALPGFRPVPAQSAEAFSYEQARALALSLLRRAMAALPPADAQLARAAAAQLAHARFLASTDRRSARTCASGEYSLFVDPHVAGDVFVCDEVRPHAQAGGAAAVAILAQGFVHESAHLAGIRDECAATRFELAVMDRTIGRRSAGSRIRYGAMCGR